MTTVCQRACFWCDESFQPKKSRQRFCSRKCALRRNALLARIVAGAEDEEQKIHLVFVIRHLGVCALTPEDWQSIQRCNKAHMRFVQSHQTAEDRHEMGKRLAARSHPQSAEKRAAASRRLHARNAALSPEQRSANARKAALAGHAKRRGSA